MTKLSFGVQLLPQQVSWEEWRDGWLLAEQLGFGSLWSYDHVHAPRGVPEKPCFEGWMGLAALAALTKRATVGMLVSGVSYRNPALLVKMATTLDHVVGGRSILGLGAGWHVSEHEGYGWGFPSPGERVSRLSEALRIAHALWETPPGQPVSFEGTYYTLKDAFANPGPIRKPHPPILVAGGGPRIVRLTARYADMYDCWPPLDEVRKRHEQLRQECQRIGRPVDQITTSVSMDFLYDPDPKKLAARTEEVLAHQTRPPEVVRPRILGGDAAAMIEQLRPFAEAGVQQVILHVGSPYDLAGLGAFAREVIPAFRG